ncbi:MAG: VPLPA-CTERM sorting domain-containing protein [Pedobacter sp.]
MNLRKIIIYKSLLFGALCAATLAASPDFAHATLGLNFSAATPIDNGGPVALTGDDSTTGYSTVGWSFRANTDLYLTRLGVYDADKDRAHSEAHLVGIWSNGSLLDSVSIDEAKNNVPVASAPGMAQFHYGALNSALLLHSGQTYFVGATLYSGTVTASGTIAKANTNEFDAFASINNEVPVTVNQNITYLASSYGINATTNQLTFPGATDYPATYTVGANIDVTPTPIPAAVWLLGSGLLGLVGVGRRKSEAGFQRKVNARQQFIGHRATRVDDLLL